MSVHLTEEEQLEVFKRWWAENGRSIVIGVVLAVGAYFGWQGWQTQTQKNLEAAASLYEDLSLIVAPEGNAEITEDQRTTAYSIIDELKDRHSSSLYASNGAMFAAQIAVEEGDLDRAADELKWVMENNAGEPMEYLARQRLAQVRMSQEDYAAALDLLDTTNAAGYEGLYADLRGDIYMAQQEYEQAEAAYNEALDNLLQTQNSRRSLIMMKLDSVKSMTAVNTGTDASTSQSGDVQTLPENVSEPETEAEVAVDSEQEVDD